MIAIGTFQFHVLETEFTDPQFGLFAILFWVRRKVPSIDLIPTNLYFVNVFDFCDL